MSTIFFSPQFEYTKDLLEYIENSNFCIINNCYMDSDGLTEVIDVTLELPEVPQRPLYGIKKEERILIKIKDTEIPMVFCRDDFTIIPHLNVSLDNIKTLCLYNLPDYDIKYQHNPSAFLKRIKDWFILSAKGELHQSEQGAEPFFQIPPNFVLVREFNFDCFKFYKSTNINGFNVLQQDNSSGIVYGELFFAIHYNTTDEIIYKLPKNLAELDSYFSEVEIIKHIKDSLTDFWEIKQYPKLYNKYFSQSMQKLKECPILVHIEIKRGNNFTHKIFKFRYNFSQLLTNMGCKIENNKLNFKNKKINLETFELTPFELITHYNAERASMYNGNRELSCNDSNYVQFGLGALGSQVANNFIRAGFGKWLYVDNDTFMPHNLARHCLDSSSIFKNKAEEMCEFVKKNYVLDKDRDRYNCSRENILINEFGNDLEIAIKDATMIIDTSTSVALARKLSNTIAQSTRCTSIFLNPCGDTLVVLMESKDRKIKLDMLEMKYYQLLITDTRLENHYKSIESIQYATSCRSLSSVIPQDNLSIFSGLSSKIIKANVDNDDGLIKLYKLDDISVQEINGKPEIFEEYPENGWTIKISSSLQIELNKYRKNNLPNETGGTLIGAFDFEYKIIYIVKSLYPDDSQGSPHSFIRGKNGLSKEIENIQEKTLGHLAYVGEWHSHPTKNLDQSSDDKILMKEIKKFSSQFSQPACMIIVGDNKIKIYVE